MISFVIYRKAWNGVANRPHIFSTPIIKVDRVYIVFNSTIKSYAKGCSFMLYRKEIHLPVGGEIDIR